MTAPPSFPGQTAARQLLIFPTKARAGARPPGISFVPQKRKGGCALIGRPQIVCDLFTLSKSLVLLYGGLCAGCMRELGAAERLSSTCTGQALAHDQLGKLRALLGPAVCPGLQVAAVDRLGMPSDGLPARRFTRVVNHYQLASHWRP
jgi:hypothetical protein